MFSSNQRRYHTGLIRSGLRITKDEIRQIIFAKIQKIVKIIHFPIKNSGINRGISDLKLPQKSSVPGICATEIVIIVCSCLPQASAPPRVLYRLPLPPGRESPSPTCPPGKTEMLSQLSLCEYVHLVNLPHHAVFDFSHTVSMNMNG